MIRIVKHEGNVLNGKREGEGVMTYFNRCVYRGEWENGKCHGKVY
jgi:hypothetical protein